MPREKKARRFATFGWEEEANILFKTKEGQELGIGVLVNLASLLDVAITTGNCWMNIGMPKGKFVPQVTLHEEDEDAYASGVTFEAFLREFRDL